MDLGPALEGPTPDRWRVPRWALREHTRGQVWVQAAPSAGHTGGQKALPSTPGGEGSRPGPPGGAAPRVLTCDDGGEAPAHDVVEAHGPRVDVAHLGEHAVDVQALHGGPGEGAQVDVVQDDGDHRAQELRGGAAVSASPRGGGAGRGRGAEKGDPAGCLLPAIHPGAAKHQQSQRLRLPTEGRAAGVSGTPPTPPTQISAMSERNLGLGGGTGEQSLMLSLEAANW